MLTALGLVLPPQPDALIHFYNFEFAFSVVVCLPHDPQCFPSIELQTQLRNCYDARFTFEYESSYLPKFDATYMGFIDMNCCLKNIVCVKLRNLRVIQNYAENERETKVSLLLCRKAICADQIKGWETMEQSCGHMTSFIFQMLQDNFFYEPPHQTNFVPVTLGRQWLLIA